MTLKRNPPALALMSSHLHVLCLLAKDGGARQTELAQLLRMTLRTINRIIQDLRQAGYITAVRGSARRNSYTLRLERRLQHPLERGPSVGQLLGLFVHAAEPDVRGAALRDA